VGTQTATIANYRHEKLNHSKNKGSEGGKSETKLVINQQHEERRKIL
jgi:hypothetical protein